MNNYTYPRIFFTLFFLSFNNMFIANVNPQPGENLWELTARIGECIDAESTKLDWIESQNDLICSKVEKVDEDLFIHNEVVCSKLENLTTLVENIDITSMNDNLAALCSKIEKVDEDLFIHNEVICSKLEKLAGELETHNDVICSKLENISSKIDEIEFVGTCETLIFQSDIPFTISNPGVYCLAESINFTSDTAITVAANNVILDLNEKKIDGSGGGSIGIAVNSGLQNITIENGTLCNMDDKGINADATSNIAFVSMSILDSLVDMPLLISPITCLQIKDIKVVDVGKFKEFSIVSVVDSVTDVPDCILSSITGININCATEVTLNNCQAFHCFGDGFALQQVDNAVITSCNAEQNGGNGFVLDNVDTSYFKWCKANINCFNGVCDSACNGDNFYLGCIAKQNGIHGFNIAGGGKVLQECIASQNTSNGFNLSTSLLVDGDLDTTFGSGGKVITNFGGSSTEQVFGVKTQKDGKIVVAGSTDFQNPQSDFAVARYNADGSLDNTWGIGGLVTTDFGGSDLCGPIVIQKNGKIVVSGVVGPQTTSDFALARYNTDGSLDLSFGIGGKVTTSFSDNADFGASMAIQKDEKLVVAGIASILSNATFAVARYNNDGSLDATFGVGGKVTTSFGANSSSLGLAVVIQKDGKIVVAGSVEDTERDFAVARYNVDGSLDNTFGNGGLVRTSFGLSGSGARGMAIQKNGKIVVVGSSGDNHTLIRYNTDGSLDNTFGTGGIVVTNFGMGSQSDARAVVIQKDGKIVVTGVTNFAGDFDFAVVRYNTDGSLDVNFGIGGKVLTDFVGNDQANAINIQKDGKILAAGTTDTDSDFAVARYVVFKRGVAVRDCIAEENGADGFNIAGEAYDVRDSAAIHNVIDGFLLESLSDSCQLLSNEALQNSNIGIENLGSNNQFFNNRSHVNINGNYVGVSLVTTPTLTTGFWANVEV